MDSKGLIPRPTLLPESAPRLLVVAPAGFGKTSLLRQWAEGKDPLWITASVSPEGKAQLVEALCRALGQDERPLETILPQLSGRALVLDDLQLLTEPQDRQALETLIEASDPFSLALGSRTEPNLSALHRRRVRQQLTEISAQDLGFHGTDLRHWMAQMLPEPLSPETLQLLESRTQGWAAALVLTAQRLSHLPPAQWYATVEALSGHSQTLYDYLASELLETLPPPLRQFVLEQSVVATLKPSVENRAFLRELERRRLLLPGEQGGFVLHALLAEFLQARLEEQLGRDAFRAHCDSHAQRLWDTGAWEAAFRLWWGQGFPERIAAAISATHQERYLDYFPWTKLLPLTLLEHYPLALRLRGVAEAETRGESAEAVLLQAEALLPPREVPEAQLARVRHYRYGNLWEKALALLQELEPALKEPSPLRVRLLQEWAFYHHAHAELGQAGRTLDEAIVLLKEVGGTPVQQASVLVQRATMTDLWQGNFARVREAAQQIEELFAPQPPPVILAFLSVLAAEVAFHTGSPDRERIYQQLHTRAEAVGYSVLKRMAQGFLVYEAARRGQPTSYENLEMDQEYAWLTELVRSYRGESRLGELSPTKPGNCLWWRFAEPLLARGESREALRLLESAYQASDELENPFAKMMTCFWSALVQPGHPRLQECLELARIHGYEDLLLWQPQCERLLAHALAAGVEEELTRQLLERKATPIWCLRGFGGLDVADQRGAISWPRPKARALFALLWLAEGKSLLVERVVATLWPDADEEKGRQSYRTHCTYLRKALGDDCLETTQEHVRLVLPAVRFEDRQVLLSAHAGEDSLLWAHALLVVGTREFLPEFCYDDWALPEREHLHRLRQELRLRLAQHHLASRRPEAALELCRTALTEDSLDEDAALTGVMSLVALERMGEARSLWGAFLRALEATGLSATLTGKNTIQKLGLA